MTTYAEELEANRRLCMLRLLLEQEGSANDSVLEIGMKAMGHRLGVDRAYVRAMVRFLETAMLVRIEILRDVVMVAHITDRGANVAQGHQRCEGVARPAFGS
jgi:hypothetical protein